MAITKILLATSIAPFDVENQKVAVNTWLEAGFDVVSLNAPEEIAILEDQVPSVRFVALDRDGRKEHGKPYPYIYDMMQYLLQSGYEVTGIINSDIHMTNFTDGLYTAIYDSALEGNLVYAHRMETKSLSAEDMRESFYYFLGIDVFFFNRDTLSIFDDDGFCIGNCIWDYWIPMTAVHHHILQKEIKNLCFWHVRHEIRWDKMKLDQYLLKLADKYYDSDYDITCSFFSSHMARNNNAIWFIPVEYHNRKVLAIIPDETEDRTLESVCTQTHSIDMVREKEFPNINQAEYDYLFFVKNGHIYENCAIDIGIYEMELRNCDEAVWGSSFVVEEENKPCRWMGAFYINNASTLVRSRPNTGGKCRLGSSFSIVSNLFYVSKKVSKLGELIIYPAGDCAKYLLRRAAEQKIALNIAAFSDGDPSKWGDSLQGHPIVQPEMLTRMSFDFVLLCSLDYSDAIFERLSKLVPLEKICRIDRLIEYGDPNWIKNNEGAIREVLN